MSNTKYNTFTATTSAQLIIVANSRRKGFNLHNTSAVTCYWGFDSSVTTSNGFPLLTNGTHFNSGTSDGYRGDVYILAITGTADVRFQEWGQ